MKFTKIKRFLFFVFSITILCTTVPLAGQNQKISKTQKQILTKLEDKLASGDSIILQECNRLIAKTDSIQDLDFRLHLYLLKGQYLKSQNLYKEYAQILEEGWLQAQRSNPIAYIDLFFPHLPSSMWQTGNYSKAIKYYLFLENNYTSLENPDILHSIYNANGLIYQRLNYPDKAKKYYLKAIQICKEGNKTNSLAITLTNLAALHYQMGEYLKAFTLFKQGVKLEEETKQYLAAGRTYTYMAKTLMAIGDTAQAKHYIVKAHKNNTQENDLLGLIRTQIAQAEFSLPKNTLPKAIKDIRKTITLAQNAGFKEEEKQAWESLASLYSKNNQHDSAFVALQQQVQLTNELFNIEDVLTSQKLAYELELEQHEHQSSQMRLEQQHLRLRAMVIGFIGLIILLSIIVHLYLRVRVSRKKLQKKNIESEKQRQELQQLNKKLTKAYAEVEKANTLKSHFLNNISHEIRTPLNGILGFSAIIASDDLNYTEKQEYFKMIEHNSYALMETIDDIVNMALISAKEVKVQKAPIDVNSLLEEINELFNIERQITNKHQLEIIQIKLQKNEILLSDAGKLRTILTKLMDNALKFTEEGEIKFGCKPHDNAIEWFVKDTGMGIPELHHNKIFEKFYQVEQNRTRSFEGSGLGLTIASNYVKLLGGHMWFESVPGKGSHFHFVLPKGEVVKKN